MNLIPKELHPVNSRSFGENELVTEVPFLDRVPPNFEYAKIHGNAYMLKNLNK
jgi:hypothetical protein